MKLFDFYTEYDYGRDIYFILGQFRKFNLFDISFHASVYCDWEPNIRFGFGIFDGSLFSFYLHISLLSLNINLLNYRCPMDLSYYRGT
jgi:hypothetical protein